MKDSDYNYVSFVHAKTVIQKAFYFKYWRIHNVYYISPYRHGDLFGFKKTDAIDHAFGATISQLQTCITP